MLVAGVVVIGLAFVPDVLLTVHLSTGGWFGAVGAALVNRLSMTLTVLGCTLLVGGLIVASMARPPSEGG